MRNTISHWKQAVPSSEGESKQICHFSRKKLGDSSFWYSLQLAAVVAVRFQINYALVIVGWHSFFLSIIYASLLGRNAATCILACDLVGDGFLVIKLIPIKET